ncbi:HyaD/HybD family hydrogenase maturation endopeptidase [Helicobacter cetorum]|uniref:Hydrogenase expression/formation protein n=1 Tax=Helicobacter cetorum (strain ATCC BAA-429 / MIT 00-7128) TaxID=182217 RepID=I0ENH3_HELC0|nr:HyaD/HybD family hydrogenase maturation endopeptidase [Helicobacter cetorum]AFI04492.1 hydrogenase expression/formation protein [Helicobacter cetorum MIT 00-7128]
MSKILILGIGNILFGDEGIGVHLAHYLKRNFSFSPSIDIVDGGTMAQQLIPLITSYEKVLILDCVSAKDVEIGSVYAFDFNHAPREITWAGSAHEVEMLHTLRLTEFLGDLPKTFIVGLVPFVIGSETTFKLSKEILNALNTALKAIETQLKTWGVTMQRIDNIALENIAELSYKGF